MTAEQAVALAKNKGTKEASALRVQVGDELALCFDFLCSTCSQIVARYLELIGKQQKHKSALRPAT